MPYTAMTTWHCGDVEVILCHGRSEQRANAELSAVGAIDLLVDRDTVRLLFDGGICESVRWPDVLVRLPVRMAGASEPEENSEFLDATPEGSLEDLANARKSGHPSICVDRTVRWGRWIAGAQGFKGV